VPIGGSDLYVRLWSQISGQWQFNDYTYHTLDGRARITNPSNGSTLTSSSVTFSWTSGSGVSNYYLYVGTSPGGNNIFNNFVSSSSQNVSGLPTDGRTVYVRLWSQLGGVWQFIDYTYQASR
ncbi:MAG TPA: hypothetical protein VJ842_07685, partial [Pyrinomonadaceae bacterium]|nr:hypothetical protein [Pyrinomonadaceae bacterium]